MTNYRRVKQHGITSFFTVVTYKRRHLFEDENARRLLKTAFETTKKKYPFKQRAICLLPDHLHCIWTLPEDDEDYSTRWAFIKSTFTRLFNDEKTKMIRPSLEGKREKAIWQRRFWDHMIRDEEDMRRHVDYIHYNPVKHNLAESPAQWKWSSFHQYVARGIYEPEWNPYSQEDNFNYGE